MRRAAIIVAFLAVMLPWRAVSSYLALRPEPTFNPELWRARLETTKGPIVIEVHRAWGPHGADRFYQLVTERYFDDSRFFRVVKGQWAQFGINGDPRVATMWRSRTIPDDPNKASVIRGRVAFAFKDPNGRTTQVYISLRDNSSQDAQGFAPFGEVVE